MVDFRKATAKKRVARLDLNPSAADRWTTCTASPGFIMDNWDKVPPDDTAYNQEGTTAHEVAAALLQDRPPFVDNKYYCPVPITPEMHWHAWNYADYIAGLRAPGGKLLVEQKLPLWYMPGRNALIDAAVINPDSVHIIDYKYGEGIVVSPENNLQATIYAESVLLANSISAPPPITVHIFQPRGRAASDSPSHVWKVDIDTFLRLKDKITKAARDILIGGLFPENDLKFAPSEKACQWCPAKGFCPARHEAFGKDVPTLATIPAGDKHLPPVKAVSVTQLAAILKHKANIIRWLNDAEAYALQHMSAGGTIPGFKLVTSRQGNRAWSDQKKAAKLLLEQTHLRRDEVIEEKTIGPARVEELLGKNSFTKELLSLVARSPGRPVIAPEDDERESCLIDAKTEFGPTLDDL